MEGINKVHQANNLTERVLYFLCLVRSKLKCACGRSPVVIGVLKMFKKTWKSFRIFSVQLNFNLNWILQQWRLLLPASRFLNIAKTFNIEFMLMIFQVSNPIYGERVYSTAYLLVQTQLLSFTRFYCGKIENGHESWHGDVQKWGLFTLVIFWTFW